MAILQVNFLSQTLKRTVPIQVVLPRTRRSPMAEALKN